MITMQHNQVEALQDRPYRQALGILLNTPEAVYMGPNMRSFGHHGIGGSIGFCDPDARMGFAYACNKMHAVGTNGPRAARLIDAFYECELGGSGRRRDAAVHVQHLAVDEARVVAQQEGDGFRVVFLGAVTPQRYAGGALLVLFPRV